MTETHFKTIKYMIKNKDWSYFKFVIIGLDRFHHAFWKYYDKKHPKYEPGNKFESKMKRILVGLAGLVVVGCSDGPVDTDIDDNKGAITNFAWDPIVDEYYETEKTIDKTVEHMEHLNYKYRFNKIFVDPSSVTWIERAKEKKLRAFKADNDLDSGIAKCKALFASIVNTIREPRGYFGPQS